MRSRQSWIPGEPVERWARAVCRFPRLIIGLFAVITVALGFYAARHIGVDADTTETFSNSLEWRQDAIAYERAFPHENDLLLVVLEGETAERTDDAAELLSEVLTARDDLFAEIYRPGADPFLRRNALLFLPMDELQSVALRLNVLQPFLGRIIRSPGLVTLLETASLALEFEIAASDETIAKVFDAFAESLHAAARGEARPISWRAIVFPPQGERAEHPDAPARSVIRLTTRPNHNSVVPGVGPIQAAREAFASLEIEGVRMRLTGPVALRHDEFGSLRREGVLMGVVSFTLVALLLYLALRSRWFTTATLITMLVGLTATTAFAAATVGRLNMISIAFAPIFIGVAIDYPIHLGLRFRELCGRQLPVERALALAMRDVVPSLLICAATTAAAFLAFVATSFVSVAELGIIASAGVGLSLVTTLSLFPALLVLHPAPDRPATRRIPRPLRGTARDGGDGADGINPWRGRRAILLATLLVLGASLIPALDIRFDANRMNMRDPDAESVATLNDLAEDERFTLLNAVALADTLEHAERLRERLEALEEVESVRTIRSFVPEGQEAKLEILESLSVALGFLTSEFDPPPDSTLAERVAMFERLHTAAAAHQNPTPEVGRLRTAASALLQALREADEEEQGAMLDALEESLLSELDSLYEGLVDAVNAHPVTLDDVPSSIRTHWIGRNGRLKVEILPAEDISDNDALRRFVEAVLRVAPHATGPSVRAHLAGESIVEAFRTALMLSGAAIAAMMLLSFRSAGAPLVVLVAIGLAGVLLVATAGLADIAFNFANIITVPLILGLGVDSAIHMVHRIRAGLPAGPALAGSSTVRGVIFSSLTTMFGFSGLLFSAHPGTASMAWLLIPGVAYTALSALLLVPVLYSSSRGH